VKIINSYPARGIRWARVPYFSFQAAITVLDVGTFQGETTTIRRAIASLIEEYRFQERPRGFTRKRLCCTDRPVSALSPPYVIV
jgi:hypothetical protein